MPTALTIGTFDGVHRGHAALIARARTLATPHAAPPATKVIALCFDPHPLTLLNPAAAPPRLTSFDERAALLREAGADDVIQLNPTQDLLDLTPEAFIDRLVADHAPIAIVEGPDFCFGRRRSGTLDTLRALGTIHHFTTDVVDPVEVALNDHTIVRASSSITRWLLSHGRVADAAAVLGRPYTLTATVVQGDRRGRTIGFPTTNLNTDQLLPADAVYACRATLPTGTTHPAALSIGTKPTFNGTTRTAEAHIILSASSRSSEPSRSGSTSWSPLPNLPEYNWTLKLDVLAWLRDQVRFHSLDALRDQLHRDCRRTIDHCTTTPTPAPPHSPTHSQAHT